MRRHANNELAALFILNCQVPAKRRLLHVELNVEHVLEGRLVWRQNH